MELKENYKHIKDKIYWKENKPYWKNSDKKVSSYFRAKPKKAHKEAFLGIGKSWHELFSECNV